MLSSAEAEALGAPARPSSLRPEKIALMSAGASAPVGTVVLDAAILDVSYQGPVRRITARTPTGLVLVAAVPAGQAGEIERGALVRFAVRSDALQPMESEE